MIELKSIPILDKEPSPDCKGLFFRANVHSYLSSHKSIEVRKSLRLLKQKSCRGCKKCAWIWDFIKEDIYDCGIEDYIGEIKKGKIYKIVPHWSPSPYDYPADGDMEIEFIEVKKDKEKS